MVVDERDGGEDEEILHAFCGTKFVLILAYVSRAIKTRDVSRIHVLLWRRGDYQVGMWWLVTGPWC